MWKLGNGVGESEALVTIIHVANHGRASGACRSWPFHRVWDREGGWEVHRGRVRRVGDGPSIGYGIEKAGGKCIEGEWGV